MFQNVRITKFVKRLIKWGRKNNKVVDIKGDAEKPQTGRTSVAVISSYGSYAEEPVTIYNTESKEAKVADEVPEKGIKRNKYGILVYKSKQPLKRSSL